MNSTFNPPLVPKDETDTRLIFHLLYPRDGSNSSVNANTPREWCTVKYPDIDTAIRLLLNLGKQAVMAKSDLKSAFRLLGMSKKSWPWLVMMAKNPIDGKIYYFFEKCLPFGSAISCAIFQAFSDALAHIVRFKMEQDLVNYLDDYLFAAIRKLWCDHQLEVFLETCSEINFPVSHDKTIRATTVIVFLGFLLNAENQTLSLPVGKIEKAKSILAQVLKKKKITVHYLQRLCGFLNYL